jgi:hypothetical protein
VDYLRWILRVEYLKRSDGEPYARLPYDTAYRCFVLLALGVVAELKFYLLTP